MVPLPREFSKPFLSGERGVWKESVCISLVFPVPGERRDSRQGQFS